MKKTIAPLRAIAPIVKIYLPQSFKTMEEKQFTIGQRVKLVALPPYIKTAEPMPMLRPPNVVRLGEEGTVLDRRPGGYWGVRFEKGAFLLDSQYIEAVVPPTAPPTSETPDVPPQ